MRDSRTSIIIINIKFCVSSLIKMERTLLIPFARKGMRVTRRGKIILLKI